MSALLISLLSSRIHPSISVVGAALPVEFQVNVQLVIVRLEAETPSIAFG